MNISFAELLLSFAYLDRGNKRPGVFAILLNVPLDKREFSRIYFLLNRIMRAGKIVAEFRGERKFDLQQLHRHC